MRLFVLIILAYSQNAIADKNLALLKNSTGDSVYINNNVCFNARGATDGRLSNDSHNCGCFLGGGLSEVAWLMVDLEAPYFIDRMTLITDAYSFGYMSHFIAGGSNAGNTPQRGTYYICNQYEFFITISDAYTVKCNANIPALRYIIIQQRINAGASLNVCELLVYEARSKDSKLWNRLVDRRLIQTALLSFEKKSVKSCLAQCSQLKCDSVNYNPKSGSCEVFVHPFGYFNGSVPTKIVYFCDFA
ncbi:hypothetical protein HELRODRAFT_183196 [Helobdella robusta]|uniref:Apple domain-containing protein n=1 Tax=Helobdella robusta TaxID=6412 RepID=T1FJA3_HELRO|nr:hypothetical protein HELRODRAFT_183196 [Helobdella robusta]ESO11410.1 hypothetical protein HELRODRAFT_183196 [Helobdella robusta]